MKWILTVAAALLISQSAYSKKHEYHWRNGTLTLVNVESDQPSVSPQPDLSVPPGIQVLPRTFTYKVDGKEGIYLVNIRPEPLGEFSAVNVRYDIDGATMHVDTAAEGKKAKIKDLHIFKFTAR